jgi:hypothetical protein
MTHGIRKGLEDIAWELKGIRNILASLWHSRYSNGETDMLNPEAYADEYISTEECARRLNISDQTIRNWITVGKKNVDKGWEEGIHYVNIAPGDMKKPVIRIPWNHLIQAFAKNKKVDILDLRKDARLYQIPERFKEFQ